MMDQLIPGKVNQSMIHDLWNYSLVNISGNEIKISNILVALMMFIICIRFSNKLIKIIIKLLAKKLQNDQDAINTIERLLSYFFGILTVFISLQIANISLAIFAFVGGALAIGIGFGAQGVINNFINTIILMLEKPVKIGDVIEIQGVVGKVKSIGNRYITISSFNSKEVLVPNSDLIQNKVSKWNSDGNKLVYYVYVNIIKGTDKEMGLRIDHKLIINQINLAAQGLTFLLAKHKTEIYLTNIGKFEDQFCLVLFCDKNLLKSDESTKNEINMSLLKELEGVFTVDYSKNLLA